MGLGVAANEFQGYVDNFGAATTDTGFGTSTPAPVGTNTKATPVSVLSGALLLDDCYFLWLGFTNGGAAAGNQKYLVDVLLDPAGGTNWGPAVINNLYLHQPHFQGGVYQYAFPLFIRHGTSIGIATQSNTASATLRTLVRCHTRPSAPELIKTGSYVKTYGAVLGTTTGTTVTPGTSVWGSYTSSLGTLDRDLWWWQAGLGFSDTTLTVHGYVYEVACGDANVKNVCMTNFWGSSAAEECGQSWAGLCYPTRYVKAGQSVFLRAAANAAPDTTPTCVVYGMGG